MDNAADDDVLAEQDRKHFSEEQQTAPVRIKTVTGAVTVRKSGTMPVGIFQPLQGKVVPGAARSLAALHKLTKQGYTWQ